MAGRWAMIHGRKNEPGYRYVCSRHWTRWGASDFALMMEQGARAQGHYDQLYWVERARPGDVPGTWTVDEDQAPGGLTWPMR